MEAALSEENREYLTSTQVLVKRACNCDVFAQSELTPADGLSLSCWPVFSVVDINHVDMIGLSRDIEESL